jgi:predicted RNase H-like nuclease
MNLCKALLGLGRFPEAEKEQRSVLLTLRQRLGEVHPEVALATLNLAATLRFEKKYTEALELAQRAEVQLAKIMGPDQAKVLEARQICRDIQEEMAKKGGK